jgi:ATP-dependent Lon protease
MVVALTSLLTGHPPKPRTAMTGEVTLTGQVLPVGGIKEKVLAAYRAGVTTVILPVENKKDYFEDVPAAIRDHLEVRFAKSAADAVRWAL